jgi:hypothetical protein
MPQDRIDASQVYGRSLPDQGQPLRTHADAHGLPEAEKRVA